MWLPALADVLQATNSKRIENAKRQPRRSTTTHKDAISTAKQIITVILWPIIQADQEIGHHVLNQIAETINFDILGAKTILYILDTTQRRSSVKKVSHMTWQIPATARMMTYYHHKEPDD